MMSSTSSLDQLIYQNAISMKTEKVPSNPIIGDTSLEGGVEHFRCILSKPGKKVDVYVSINPEGDHLTLTDVMLIMAMDASGCKMLEGYEQSQWSSVFAGSDGNLKEMEEFWQEYRGRCTQTEKFRKFLGDSAYEQLVRSFAPELGMR